MLGLSLGEVRIKLEGGGRGGEIYASWGRNSNICEDTDVRSCLTHLAEQSRGLRGLVGNKTRGLIRSQSASCTAMKLKYLESEDIMSDFKTGVNCTFQKEHLGSNAEDR